MTSCDDVQVYLALRPADRGVTEERRVSAHLAVCAECAVRAETYAEQDRLIRSAPWVTLTPSQRDEVLSTVERRRSRHKMRSRLYAVAGAAAAVVGVIALLFGGKLLGSPDVQQLIPGAPLPGGGSEPPMGRTARFTTVDFTVVGHEVTGCMPLGSGEEHCPPGVQGFAWVEFIVKNSERYATADNGPQISVVHQGQSLPEMLFFPEGKMPRSACTPDGYYRDEPCHFWIGAVLPDDVDAADLKVEARWHDQVAVWTLGGDEEVRVFSAPQFEWPTPRREISGWAFQDPRNPDHAGIDIAAAKGDPILSIADGEVTFAGWGEERGYMVIVEHADGWTSSYAQLDKITVEVGQSVDQGDLLGEAGSTGDSSGPHLHFELRQDGQPVDPLHHLPPTSEESLDAFGPFLFADEIQLEQPLGTVAVWREDAAPSDPSTSASLVIPLHWNVLQPLSADWRVFVHLENQEGELVIQHDGEVDWFTHASGHDTQSPERTLSSDFTLPIPTDFPPGLYTVRVGLYDPQTGERAVVTRSQHAGDTSVALQKLELPPSSGAEKKAIEEELARLFVDDPSAECGWEVLGEADQETYVWAVCQAPSGTAVSAPAVLTWRTAESGGRRLGDAKMPRHGSFYGEDVAELFPPSVQERIFDRDVDMDGMWQQIEQDLTWVTGTVMDNAASAELVTVEDDDGEQWHVLWRAGDAVRWLDGTRAEFRDVQRGMTVEVVGFARPEAAMRNVLAVARVTILREPEDAGTSLEDLLLRWEELPGTAVDGDDWEPETIHSKGDDWVTNLARADGCLDALKVEGFRQVEPGTGGVYVWNGVYRFETAGQARDEYEALLAGDMLTFDEIVDAHTADGAMEATAMAFTGSEGEAIYWLFGVEENTVHLLMVDSFGDEAARAFFEATVAQMTGTAKATPTPEAGMAPGVDGVIDCAAVYPGLPGCLRAEPLVGGRLAFVDERAPFDGRPVILDLEQGDAHILGNDADGIRGWSPSGACLLTGRGVYGADGELAIDLMASEWPAPAFWAPAGLFSDERDWLIRQTDYGGLEAVTEGELEPLPPMGPLATDGRDSVLLSTEGQIAWTPGMDRLVEAGEWGQELHVQSLGGTGAPFLLHLSDDIRETYYRLIDWVPGARLILAGRGLVSASMWADGVPLVTIDTERGEITDLGVTMLLTSEAYDWHPTRPGLVALAGGGGRFINENKRLALLDVTSGDLTTLTEEDEAVFAPAWSPDGTRLAYAAVPASPAATGDGQTLEEALEGRAIHVVDASTGESRTLTEPGEAIDGWPRWAADGEQLLYTRQTKGQTDVRVVALDGTEDELLVTGLADPMCYYGGCAWDSRLGYVK